VEDPYILRAIGRAWSWRRRMEAGEFGTVRDLAIAVVLAKRHDSADGLSRAGGAEALGLQP
jgi:hypothetical protein